MNYCYESSGAHFCAIFEKCISVFLRTRFGEHQGARAQEHQGARRRFSQQIPRGRGSFYHEIPSKKKNLGGPILGLTARLGPSSAQNRTPRGILILTDVHESSGAHLRLIFGCSPPGIPKVIKNRSTWGSGKWRNAWQLVGGIKHPTGNRENARRGTRRELWNSSGGKLRRALSASL